MAGENSYPPESAVVAQAGNAQRFSIWKNGTDDYSHTELSTIERRGLDEGWYKPNTNNGYCMCGCGQKTNLASATKKSAGKIKDRHVRFLPGHLSFDIRSAIRLITVEQAALEGWYKPNLRNGYCYCGCGSLAPVAPQTSRSAGTVKDQSMRFCLNHGVRVQDDGTRYNGSGRIGWTETEAIQSGRYVPNPSGLCRCGCGQRTSIARNNDSHHGTVRGKPRQYVRGHANSTFIGPAGCANGHAYDPLNVWLVGDRETCRTCRRQCIVAGWSRRRALEKSVRHEDWTHDQVFQADSYTCVYCGFTGTGVENLHADHIIALALGGEDTLHNIATACHSCNRRKWSKTLPEFFSHMERNHPEVTIIHPNYTLSASHV